MMQKKLFKPFTLKLSMCELVLEFPKRMYQSVAWLGNILDHLMHLMISQPFTHCGIMIILGEFVSPNINCFPLWDNK